MTERQEQETRKLISEIRARQSNTIWPDTLRNSRSVDAFLWKGAPNAPLVQRAGAWIFGITFLLFGVLFLDLAHKKHSPFELVFALAWFALGMRIFRNGFLRKETAKPKNQDQ